MDVRMESETAAQIEVLPPFQYIDTKKESLPRYRVNKPPTIRPKRDAVQIPLPVYPKPPELSTRPSARHMSTLSGRVWRAVVRS